MERLAVGLEFHPDARLHSEARSEIIRLRSEVEDLHVSYNREYVEHSEALWKRINNLRSSNGLLTEVAEAARDLDSTSEFGWFVHSLVASVNWTVGDDDWNDISEEFNRFAGALRNALAALAPVSEQKED